MQKTFMEELFDDYTPDMKLLADLLRIMEKDSKKKVINLMIDESFKMRLVYLFNTHPDAYWNDEKWRIPGYTLVHIFPIDFTMWLVGSASNGIEGLADISVDISDEVKITPYMHSEPFDFESLRFHKHWPAGFEQMVRILMVVSGFFNRLNLCQGEISLLQKWIMDNALFIPRRVVDSYS